jgi:hypothetical protein
MMEIELFGYLAGFLAVWGVLLNNRGVRLCFVLWIVSNSIAFCLHVNSLRPRQPGEGGGESLQPALLRPSLPARNFFHGIENFGKAR